MMCLWDGGLACLELKGSLTYVDGWWSLVLHV